MRFGLDNRGQPIGIARFGLSLLVGAFCFWIAIEITDPILSGASNATNATYSNKATGWFSAGVDLLPLFFLMISFFGLIAYSIFRRVRTR